jgi:antitoxin component of MazEF toxin-antitoxin module
MTITIKRSEENAIITLPQWLMTVLKLHEGSQVKAIIENESLRLAHFDTFLNLRGSLADDTAFDDAIETLDAGWQAWTPPASA